MRTREMYLLAKFVMEVSLDVERNKIRNANGDGVDDT